MKYQTLDFKNQLIQTRFDYVSNKMHEIAMNGLDLESVKSVNRFDELNLLQQMVSNDIQDFIMLQQNGKIRLRSLPINL